MMMLLMMILMMLLIKFLSRFWKMRIVGMLMLRNVTIVTEGRW